MSTTTISEAKVAKIVALVIAQLTDDLAPAKRDAKGRYVPATAPKAAPRQAKGKKAAAPANAPVKVLTKSTRQEFIAATENPTWVGYSTYALRALVESGHLPLPDGWALPTGKAKTAIAKAKANA